MSVVDAVYNPLDEINLGGNIVVEMIHRPPLPLNEHTSRLFEGGGVYVLYYVGRSPIYRRYHRENVARWGEKKAVFPIYVGSSFAVGVKKGLQGARNEHGKRHALANRVWKHRRTIERCRGFYSLKVQDFLYRYLPLNDAHVGLAEAALITFLRPIWNGTGFGNNAPGSGRPGAKGPNLFVYFHESAKTARAAKSRDASFKKHTQTMSAKIDAQIEQMSSPDADERIEKFMDLIRTKMKI